VRRLASLLTALLVAAPAVSSAEARYPAGARHSPMTAEVVERLRGVIAAGGGRQDVFVKIGDSITVHGGFLTCFSRNAFDLGNHAELADTIRFFSRTPADREHLSWDRKSRAATIGWSTFAAIGSEAHSPLRDEIRAVKPALAIVMMGTNETYGGGVGNYEKNLGRLVRMVLAEGVVPIVSTIPPRRDSRDLDGIVVQMNAVVRDVAEREQIPLVDYGGELRKLPGFGLGLDGIHPLAREHHPCALDDASLVNGLNVRNLMTLEALDRARRFLFEGEAPEAGLRGRSDRGSRGRVLGERARSGRGEPGPRSRLAPVVCVRRREEDPIVAQGARAQIATMGSRGRMTNSTPWYRGSMPSTHLRGSTFLALSTALAMGCHPSKPADAPTAESPSTATHADCQTCRVELWLRDESRLARSERVVIWLDGAVVFDGPPAPAVLIGTLVVDARLHELRISYSLLGLEPKKRVDVRTRFPFFGAPSNV
jgi:hypothetical protein